jgi:hypothetical protein
VQEPSGITAFEGLLGALAPATLLAYTTNVYETPFCNPPIRIGPMVPDALCPPGLATTVYVTGAPPVSPGANATAAWASPALATTLAGVAGLRAGVTALDAELARPVPTAFVARTVNVYAVPLLSPVTTRGLLEPVAVNPPGLDVTV